MPDQQPYGPPDATRALAPIPGSAAPLDGRCAAKLRRSPERYGEARYCVNQPTRGRRRCRLHGGNSPVGMAASRYVDGTHARVPFDYSLVLKGTSRLGELYAAARTNEDPLSTKMQIALYEARIASTLERIEDGTVVPTSVVQTWKDVEAAQQAIGRASTEESQRQAAGRLQDAMRAHAAAMKPEARALAAQQDLDRAHAVCDRLKRTERELQVVRHQAFTAEAAFALMGSLGALVQEQSALHIGDDETRRNLLRGVAAGLARLATRRSDPTHSTA